MRQRGICGRFSSGRNRKNGHGGGAREGLSDGFKRARKGWHGRRRRELAERAPARTRGDCFILLLVGKVEAILVVGRIPGLVLFRGHKPVSIQFIIPILWLRYFWKLGRSVMRSRRELASGWVGLVFKVVIPVFGVGHGVPWGGGWTGFGPGLESHGRWLVVEMRKGGHGAMCEKGFEVPIFGGRDWAAWVVGFRLSNVGGILRSLEDKVVVRRLWWWRCWEKGKEKRMRTHVVTNGG
jgi:hypothetical protein